MRKKVKDIARNLAVIFVVLLAIFSFSADSLKTAGITEQDALGGKLDHYKDKLLKPGKYKIILVFEKEEVRLEKIVIITVKDDKYQKTYGVYAQDIKLTVTEAKRFTINDWLARASISIYNESDQKTEVITYIDTSNILYEEGKYEVFFGNDNAAGSFIVTLVERSGNLTNEGSEGNNPVEDPLNKPEENSLATIFAKNKLSGFYDEFSNDLAEGDRRFLFLSSGIIIFFFFMTFMFLLIQFMLANGMLKKVLRFFELNKDKEK